MDGGQTPQHPRRGPIIISCYKLVKVIIRDVQVTVNGMHLNEASWNVWLESR